MYVIENVVNVSEGMFFEVGSAVDKETAVTGVGDIMMWSLPKTSFKAH